MIVAASVLIHGDSVWGVRDPIRYAQYGSVAWVRGLAVHYSAERPNWATHDTSCQGVRPSACKPVLHYTRAAKASVCRNQGTSRRGPTHPSHDLPWMAGNFTYEGMRDFAQLEARFG